MTQKICRSDILTKKFLEECFVANFETGTLTWKVRPRHHFNSERGWKVFNTQCSGKSSLNLIKKRNYQLYACQINGIRIHAHHIIWTMFHGEMFDKTVYEIDHKDRNSLNNAITNLRLVTPAENSRNKSVHGSDISYDLGRERWVVRSKFMCGTNVRGRFENKDFARKFLEYIDVENRGVYSDFYPFKYDGEDYKEIGFTPHVLNLVKKAVSNDSEFMRFLESLASKNSTRGKVASRGFGDTMISKESYKLLVECSLARMLNDNGSWKILVKHFDEWVVIQREIGGDCVYADREGARKAAIRCNKDIVIEKYWNTGK